MREIQLIHWLLESDPSVARMTRKYLLNQAPPYTEEGWIRRFLERFDPQTNTWGGGIYGPKWISTFYTLRDLQSLEIDPQNRVFQLGLTTLINKMWNPAVFVEDDVCVVAMLMSMLMYGQRQSPVLREMMDFLLARQLPDGGWNCQCRYDADPKSSVHSTLSVLEAFAECGTQGYEELAACVGKSAERGRAYLLRRQLLRRATTGELILPYICDFHFPTRWKYDLLRALLYFASIEYPFDPGMEEGLNILKAKFSKGYLQKGTTYTGKLHFVLEQSGPGTMNTLRGLRVLRFYDPAFYSALTQRSICLPDKPKNGDES